MCELYEIVSRKVKLESIDDDKNDGHPEDPDYIDQEINRTTLSDSATLLGLSPDRAGYGKQKVKKLRKV